MKTYSSTHPAAIMKFCPSCGADNFSFDGEKLFTCGSCAFTWYMNPAPAAAVIIKDSDGRIVLTRRKFEPRAGYLDLPGGFVNILESAEDAVRREIMEELGIGINSISYIGSFSNEYIFNGLSYFTCDLGFECTSDELTHMHPADDVSEAFLIRPEDIDPDEIGFPSIKKIIELYMELKKNSVA